MKELARSYAANAIELMAERLRAQRDEGRRIKVGPHAVALSDKEFDELEEAIFQIADQLSR